MIGTRTRDDIGEDAPEDGELIAVVGMAGRFPGARTLAEYWRNLRDGVESIVPIDEDELRRSGIGADALDDRGYIRSGAPLDGIDEFDAALFGFTPAVAEGLDPQHRLFLQSVWHAIEDAGYRPGELDGAVGVYGTSSASGYLLNNLMSRLDVERTIGQGASYEMIDLSLRNDKDHIATRIAHQFDLHGPALSVQTACSSSAVAVHLACQALLSGEVDAALAGGSSIRVPNRAGYWHTHGAMTSPSGHCRPFDARADGTVFGSGVGVVMLKTLERARADGDRVHAVIRGSAINNDGAAKMTYAAPTAAGQAAAIAEAHAVAGVDPADISYVETHGTGTPLGDPIEIEGLRQAFDLGERERTRACRLGSVKANIGHLEVASGIAGVLKVILALKHRAVPGTVHYTAPNPELRLGDGPFEINQDLVEWESDGPRLAGVSSFGVGGTNVHLILEEAPAPATPAPAPGPYPLLLSARGTERIDVARARLADEWEADPALEPADVAATLAARPADTTRAVTVVRDRAHAIAALRAGEGAVGSVPEGVRDDADRIALLFPGQGTQYVGMARGLYDAEPVFAQNVDRCAAGFDAALGIDLKALLFGGRSRELERTDRSQPALFTVEYALARLLEARGVVPSILVGHSIGEYVAATLAGVFDLPTALTVVAERGRVMQAAPRGVMLAVPLGEKEIAPYLGSEIDVATVNEPGGCVVAGTEDAIADLTAKLAADTITARRVRTSHAFHSRLMEPAAAQFAEFLAGVELREPRIPMASNVTGTLMSAAEATDPATWSRQMRATVRFADELDTVLAEPHRVLVEVGPGGTLTSAAKRHPGFGDGHRIARLVRHPAQDRDDREFFLEGLGTLWAAGLDVDPGVPQGREVLLPGYPFLPERHWVEAAPHRRSAPGPDAAPSGDATAAGDDGADTGTEAVLGRVWAACLGTDTVDPEADFFDLGGDSLVAIGVSMAAGHAGIDLTPQDLYDHPTVAALARAITERDAAGGLAEPTAPSQRPPLTPNLARLTESGVRDHARWRIPLVLGVGPEVTAEDVTAVLEALIARHDALRLRLRRDDGLWEQVIAEAGEAPTHLRVHEEHTAATDLDAVAQERLAALIAEADDDAAPVQALLLRPEPGGAGRLALAVPGWVGDARSREILAADLLTAFGQRAAGMQVFLAPTATGWAEWSQRLAGLAGHPAVLESRSRWLDAALPAVRIATSDPEDRPAAADYRRLPTTVGTVEAAEIDDARRRTGVRLEELVTAAIVRGVASAVGPGRVAIDLDGDARSVLKPAVDARDTVGWFTTVHPVALTAPDGDDELVEQVRTALRGVPHHGVGHGLLRYLHAPTAAHLAAAPAADLHLVVGGTVPDPPDIAQGAKAVWFAADAAMPVRDVVPGLGHPVELRVYRTGGRLHLDWWFDARRVDAARIDALAAAVTQALGALARTSAEPEDEDADDWELVDLSGGDA
ncbi:polyketide synthase [Tsukamurella pulmonis]|uniref:Phthiocerol/phenolphthiocerol synthesis type-I polyketide synthase E n=2 Tax=Tsukamurella pulmonis TaxID=47312 RepID=A0A1H1CB96_9ACTN|nr:type I polyketide synthase [Tsukamurella pulmonis]KXO89982.1 polyketide synthase [Tsukamurella pulmonis]SDQ61378.1 phthiocerol/phenolphthiocerol synthesis type-I polyketide synthase E [Tsukamurella pulmonis]SUP23950.1 Beta-ketoacyl-acyl-carrier-protein synthase I [Tsukamurella pulmonis]